MNIAKLEQLFDEYEKSFDRMDMATIAQHYLDTFMSAGPKGSIALNKKAFFGKAEEATAYYKSLGQKAGRIISKEVLHISNEYCLVTVHWGVKYEKTGDQEIAFDVSYIVQDTGDDMKIILFISHDDEEETMKNLGLQTTAST